MSLREIQKLTGSDGQFELDLYCVTHINDWDPNGRPDVHAGNMNKFSSSLRGIAT